MNIFFIVQNKSQGSSLMRAHQIKDELVKSYDNINVIELQNIEKLYNVAKSKFIWLGPIGVKHIPNFQNEHVHILDVVDKYVKNQEKLEEALQSHHYRFVIVNNSFMKNYFLQRFNLENRVVIIHHHYDVRYQNCITDIPPNELRFGYLGSTLSLLHTGNFLHYKVIGKKYNVLFFDTENAKIMNNYIFNDKMLKSFMKKKHNFESNNIPQRISINCQISIRDPSSQVFQFKTTAKLATAIALGHNIITTYEESVQDILPPDYPFLLQSTDLGHVDDMFALVHRDFYSDKKLWNQGLRILEEVKHKLSIEFIVEQYKEILA